MYSGTRHHKLHKIGHGSDITENRMSLQNWQKDEIYQEDS